MSRVAPLLLERHVLLVYQVDDGASFPCLVAPRQVEVPDSVRVGRAGEVRRDRRVERRIVLSGRHVSRIRPVGVSGNARARRELVRKILARRLDRRDFEMDVRLAVLLPEESHALLFRKNRHEERLARHVAFLEIRETVLRVQVHVSHDVTSRHSSVVVRPEQDEVEFSRLHVRILGERDEESFRVLRAVDGAVSVDGRLLPYVVLYRIPFGIYHRNFVELAFPKSVARRVVRRQRLRRHDLVVRFPHELELDGFGSRILVSGVHPRLLERIRLFRVLVGHPHGVDLLAVDVGLSVLVHDERKVLGILIALDGDFLVQDVRSGFQVQNRGRGVARHDGRFIHRLVSDLARARHRQHDSRYAVAVLGDLVDRHVEARRRLRVHDVAYRAFHVPVIAPQVVFAYEVEVVGFRIDASRKFLDLVVREIHPRSDSFLSLVLDRKNAVDLETVVVVRRVGMPVSVERVSGDVDGQTGHLLRVVSSDSERLPLVVVVQFEIVVRVVRRALRVELDPESRRFRSVHVRLDVSVERILDDVVFVRFVVRIVLRKIFELVRPVVLRRNDLFLIRLLVSAQDYPDGSRTRLLLVPLPDFLSFHGRRGDIRHDDLCVGRVVRVLDRAVRLDAEQEVVRERVSHRSGDLVQTEVSDVQTNLLVRRGGRPFLDETFRRDRRLVVSVAGLVSLSAFLSVALRRSVSLTRVGLSWFVGCVFEVDVEQLQDGARNDFLKIRLLAENHVVLNLVVRDFGVDFLLHSVHRRNLRLVRYRFDRVSPRHYLDRNDYVCGLVRRERIYREDQFSVALPHRNPRRHAYGRLIRRVSEVNLYFGRLYLNAVRNGILDDDVRNGELLVLVRHRNRVRQVVAVSHDGRRLGRSAFRIRRLVNFRIFLHDGHGRVVGRFGRGRRGRVAFVHPCDQLRLIHRRLSDVLLSDRRAHRHVHGHRSPSLYSEVRSVRGLRAVHGYRRNGRKVARLRRRPSFRVGQVVVRSREVRLVLRGVINRRRAVHVRRSVLQLLLDG